MNSFDPYWMALETAKKYGRRTDNIRPVNENQGLSVTALNWYSLWSHVDTGISVLSPIMAAHEIFCGRIIIKDVNDLTEKIFIPKLLQENYGFNTGFPSDRYEFDSNYIYTDGCFSYIMGQINQNWEIFYEGYLISKI